MHPDPEDHDPEMLRQVVSGEAFDQKQMNGKDFSPEKPGGHVRIEFEPLLNCRSVSHFLKLKNHRFIS